MKIIDTIIRFIKKRRMSNVEYYRSLGVKIGENCRIYTNRFGSEPWLISIGNNVTIAGDVTFITHDGSTWLCKDNRGRRYLFKEINIGNNIFIGSNSTILPGVVIEDNVIVAAGSVVVKSVPKGTIVGGNPAKIIGGFYQYKEKALSNFKSEEDMDFTKNYRERITQIVDKTPKPKMKIEN